MVKKESKIVIIPYTNYKFDLLSMRVLNNVKLDNVPLPYSKNKSFRMMFDGKYREFTTKDIIYAINNNVSPMEARSYRKTNCPYAKLKMCKDNPRTSLNENAQAIKNVQANANIQKIPGTNYYFDTKLDKLYNKNGEGFKKLLKNNSYILVINGTNVAARVEKIKFAIEKNISLKEIPKGYAFRIKDDKIVIEDVHNARMRALRESNQKQRLNNINDYDNVIKFCEIAKKAIITQNATDILNFINEEYDYLKSIIIKKYAIGKQNADFYLETAIIKCTNSILDESGYICNPYTYILKIVGIAIARNRKNKKNRQDYNDNRCYNI